SVSRVGGAAQVNIMKQLTKALRLELAQYHELLDFAQFGTELDEISQKRLKRGAIVVELLKQERLVRYSFVEQILILFLLREQFFDAIDRKQITVFIRQFLSYVRSVYGDVYHEIERSRDLTSEISHSLVTIATEFSKLFVPVDRDDQWIGE
ncbi:MAG: hypothetical protein WBQ73_00005, partial [Candidatus Babeliales bacterium]